MGRRRGDRADFRLLFCRRTGATGLRAEPVEPALLHRRPVHIGFPVPLGPEPCCDRPPTLEATRARKIHGIPHGAIAAVTPAPLPANCNRPRRHPLRGATDRVKAKWLGTRPIAATLWITDIGNMGVRSLYPR